MTCIRKRLLGRFVISLMAICSMGLTQNGAPAVAGQFADKPSEAVFITYQMEKTERGILSRQLLEDEAAKLYSRMEAATGKDLFGVSGRANSPTQQELTWFTLAATPQLDAVPQAKAAVLRALAKWDVVFELLYPITVRVDFGPTLFGGQFPSPGTVVTTSTPLIPTGYNGLSGLLQNATFDSRQRALYDAFPLEVLPTDKGLAQTVQLPSSLVNVLQPAVIRGNSFNIGFNSNNRFDFDSSDGIDADKLDFEALVLREVGRAMGFSTSVGDAEVRFETQPNAFPQGETIWDVFRFRDRASLADFGTAERAQLSGGEQVFFAGGDALPLSTGRPDGKGGDGRPAGHWKDDELTGQYIGIMDPTYAPGERGGITANDLAALDYFGYAIVSTSPVMEVLSNDDNSREETLSLDGALAVTRFQPGRFPCTLQSVRVQLPDGGDASPAGKQMRLVVFTDPARTGRPPANPTLLLDRTITIPALPENRLLEVMLPNVPAITAGDVYIGVQMPAGVLLGGDANVAQRRSIVSTDNGASFQPLQAAGQRPVNLIACAVIKAAYGDLAVPRISSLSPAAVAPGSGSFKLFVYGQNFTGNGTNGFNDTSVVRWNGQDRATKFVNGSLLIATIEAADVTNAGLAQVSVFTETEFNETSESASFEIAIVSTRPAPSLMRLEPPGAPSGSEAMSVKILGRNFTSASVVKWNGSERQAQFINSTELSLPLLKADLAGAGNIEISVHTPEPGGGTSNKAVFPIIPCRYTLSTTDNTAAMIGGSQGILVTTGSYCRWTAQTDVPWITFPGPSSAVGNGVLRYDIADNYVANGRTGSVIVSNAKINVRQSGFAKAVSAASFTPLIAPESIASVFSLGLGNSINSASTTPLPTRLGGLEVKLRSALGNERLAPLFFTSPEQINFLVPAGLTPGTATIFINGVFNYGTVQIASVAPGFFTANASGQGLAAAVALRVKADGTQSYEPISEFDPAQNRIVVRPIDLGAEGDKVFLLMFGTGIRGRSALSGVTVKIGGLDGEVAFAGAQTDFFGLDQVNVQLPAALRGRGEVTINCTVNGRAANPVTVTIK
jgi:uncharacterized protein (TIGR03437 family)